MSDPQEPQVSFVTFVYSLARNVAVLLGDAPDPATGETHAVDLGGAIRLLEVIMMLEHKTRGNLTVEERRLLDEILHALQTRIAAAKKDGGSAGPQPGS